MFVYAQRIGDLTDFCYVYEANWFSRENKSNGTTVPVSVKIYWVISAAPHGGYNSMEISQYHLFQLILPSQRWYHTYYCHQLGTIMQLPPFRKPVAEASLRIYGSRYRHSDMVVKNVRHRFNLPRERVGLGTRIVRAGVSRFSCRGSRSPKSWRASWSPRPLHGRKWSSDRPQPSPLSVNKQYNSR